MAWTVEYTNEFGEWWISLSEKEHITISSHIEELEKRGPNLPFPYSSGVTRSRHGVMRELRIQSGGSPFRVFYAFDPSRVAILLIGGDKTGDKRFYERMVPIADELYDVHLLELSKSKERDNGR